MSCNVQEQTATLPQKRKAFAAGHYDGSLSTQRQPTRICPHLKVAILKQQPGVFRVGPVGCRGTSAYESLPQDSLILMPGLSLVAPLQSHLGNAPEGLLPYGQW